MIPTYLVNNDVLLSSKLARSAKNLGLFNEFKSALPINAFYTT